MILKPGTVLVLKPFDRKIHKYNKTMADKEMIIITEKIELTGTKPLFYEGWWYYPDMISNIIEKSTKLDLE